ncbi:hypothetical protein EVAR_100310_1 [Eumeta japonica]|uniref:Uncharacterized protein n=1 Tax=Eumeta variegata TaxID=151549 RepID=A0A4C1ZZM8_EUMVA|nr:hypothetical protein EVAR_100310_1 [Eumeta japonica]
MPLVQRGPLSQAQLGPECCNSISGREREISVRCQSRSPALAPDVNARSRRPLLDWRYECEQIAPRS